MARATTQTSQRGRPPTHGARATTAATRKPSAAAEPKRTIPPGRKRTTEVDHVIGAKIRMRRGEIGMTQTQLANAIGVTFQQVQKYEQGTNRVGGSRLDGIAKALEVPVSYFFEQSAEDVEVAQGSLLHTHGAVSLLKAFAAIKDQRQRTALVNLTRALVGEEPLQEDEAVH